MCRTAVSHRSSGSSGPSDPDRPDHADHTPGHRAHPDRPTTLTADRTPAPPLFLGSLPQPVLTRRTGRRIIRSVDTAIIRTAS
ncbi:hypothetical protein GCM10009576_004010 [Streptomyces rhizosphaericus]|uniref:Uncharacterized protein n=2 Tax=Streptomyces rhizosphaericus TaxID=114699 RepID=A0ABP4CIM8_9ACTN